MGPQAPDQGNFSPLVWLDFETTGLNPHRDTALEIGLVATDANLRRIEGVSDLQLVIIPEAGLDITKLDPFVVEMHAKSGLLSEIAAGKGYGLSGAQGHIRTWLRGLRSTHYGSLPPGVTGTMEYKDCKFLMAGSTVGQFDRQLFERIDPHPSLLEEFFEYRVVDVSSIKELVKRWYGEAYMPPAPEKAHRVISDINDSIRELDWYRRAAFRDVVS